MTSRKIYFAEISLCKKNEVINVAKGFFTSNGNRRFTFSERNDRIGLFDDVVLKEPQRNIPENITHALAEPGITLHVH